MMLRWTLVVPSNHLPWGTSLYPVRNSNISFASFTPSRDAQIFLFSLGVIVVVSKIKRFLLFSQSVFILKCTHHILLSDAAGSGRC